MFSIFKKDINPIHTLRDYEDDFLSSKYDVLAFLPASIFETKSSKIPTKYGSKTHVSKNAKSTTKFHTFNGERPDADHPENLDTSFKKKYAEFVFYNKTFVFCKRSFYLFDENSRIRRYCVWITESPLFEIVTLAVIIFNCVLLGLRDYRDTTDSSSDNTANTILKNIEPLFITYYTIEAGLRIIARGFMYNSNTYLRSGWNYIDLFVVISGLIYTEQSMKYFSILRLGRIVRFLQTFKRFKGINHMMTIISTSFFPLISILGLLVFFMCILAIYGLNLYNGELDFRCRLTPEPIAGVWAFDSTIDNICGSSYSCPATLVCGASYQYPGQILDPKSDTYFSEFNWGLTNFDSFPQSLFTMFVIINGNWQDLLQMLSDASGNLPALVYFFMTYIICNLFIIQLAVAVMLDNFLKIKERENPKKAILSHAQISKIEGHDEKQNHAPEKRILPFKERWKTFRAKYFPKAEVPNDEYYNNPFTRYAYKFTFHPAFKYVTILLSIMNVIVVSINRYPISSYQENVIVSINFVLTVLYIIEVSLKVIALSVHKYVQDNFNTIEFVIAVISMIEITNTSGVSAFSVFRAFKLMRYMRRDYTWDNFKVLITVVFEGFTYVIDFTIVLGLYMYVFAVLGMKFFAGKLRFSTTGYVDLENGLVPRANFDTLKEAYTVIFQVIVGEGVLEVILSTIRATGWASIIFFIIIIVTGHYLLIQLFLAIILGAFSEARDKVNYGQATSKFVVARLFQRKRTRKIDSLSFLPKERGDKSLGVMIERHHAQIKSQAELESQENWIQNIKIQDELDEAIETNNHETHLTVRAMDSTRKPLVRKVVSRQEIEDYTFQKQNSLFGKRSMKIYPHQPESTPVIKPIPVKVHRTRQEKIVDMIKHIKESSLFVFHKDSKIRKTIGVIIAHKVWETIILGSILLSSILLIIDNPLNDPDSTESKVYDIADQVFTYLFILELALKIIFNGFLFNSVDNQKAYIRSYWNMIDCLVVTTSISDIATGGSSGLKSFKALRALRALRPLRIINRNEDLKVVVNALFRTFPSLYNLMIVAGLLLIIGSTTGTAYFRGKFYRCTVANDEDTMLDSPSIITEQDCLANGGEWSNPITNYDNFFQSMLTYFKMITGEGWIQALYSGVDSVDIGYEPKTWSRPIMLLYFYIVLLLGNVLIKNLFVGVVIDNFRQMKEELTGFLLLNDMQRDWAEMQIFMQRRKLKTILPTPRNHIRRLCFKFVQDPRFEKGLIFLIVINTIVLGFTHSRQSFSFEVVIQTLNLVFLGIFHAEALLKIAGIGVFYFKDAWNKFDLLVLALADATLVASLVTQNYDYATIPTVIRTLRLGQFVKSIKGSKHIRVLVDTLYFLLPSLANIGALLILIMFIYGVLGMNLFAGIKTQTYITTYSNFQDLLGALNILVRCALGQDWPYFMDELSDQTIAGCENNQTYDNYKINGVLGCGTYLAYPYFITYIVTVTLILMNLFLAVVVGGYAESKKENEAVISPHQMDEFIDKWAEYDPQGTGFLSPEEFAFLIHDLPHPLGLKDNASVKYEYDLTAKKERGYLISENKKICLKRVQLFRDMRRYDIPVYSNKVHFSDACRTISFNSVIRAYKNGIRAQKPENELDFKMDDKIEETLREKLKIKSDYVNKTLIRGWVNRYGVIKKLQKEAKLANPKGHPAVHLTQVYAGKYIHIFWKKWKDEKKLYELQIAEKKGIDYERTFEMQQRLANAQVNMHQKSTVAKTGKANRLYDKGKKRTQPSLASVPMLKEKDLKGTINNADEESYHPSILAEEAHDPHLQDSNSSVESKSEEGSLSVTSKANLDKLVEYKNNAGNIKRRGSGVSNFAQFKSFQGNEFWLQSVNPNPNEKFPIPVTIEIDNFMLNYLEQPESATSKTTESLDDTTSQELGTPPTPPNRLIGKGMFMFKSGEEEESKSGEMNSKSSIENKSQTSEESQSLGDNPEPSSNLKIVEKISIDEENAALKIDYDTQDRLDSGSETQSPEQPENKTKEKYLETARANLEIIEERHEEENQAATKPDIDIKNRIRPFDADARSGKTLKLRDNSLKILDSTGENFGKESMEKGSQEGTNLTIEAAIVATPKGNQLISEELVKEVENEEGDA